MKHGHGEKRYAKDIKLLRSPERLRRLEMDRVIALCIEDAAVQTVLDVGTGTGLFAEEFHKHGMDAVGVDPNPAMIAAARALVPDTRFLEGHAEALPFADKSFDLVFLGSVLHEMDDPLKGLQEARRVARLRVAVLDWPYLDEPEGPPLEHRIKPNDLKLLARKAGFTRIEPLPMTRLQFVRLAG